MLVIGVLGVHETSRRRLLLKSGMFLELEGFHGNISSCFNFPGFFFFLTRVFTLGDGGKGQTLSERSAPDLLLITEVCVCVCGGVSV